VIITGFPARFSFLGNDCTEQTARNLPDNLVFYDRLHGELVKRVRTERILNPRTTIRRRVDR
jgi:hypothetical protein